MALWILEFTRSTVSIGLWDGSITQVLRQLFVKGMGKQE